MSDLIISRPGYTTIMELAALNARRVVFVPTPGQLEQVYLARYLEKNGVAPWREQDCLRAEDLGFDELIYRGFADFHHLMTTGSKISIARYMEFVSGKKNGPRS